MENMKHCDVCNKEIPEFYQNLLCDDCYLKIEDENRRVQEMQEEEKKEQATTEQSSEIEAVYNIKKDIIIINGITDPEYLENPEAEDKEQWATNIKLFEKHKKLLWHPTRNIYTFIKDYCMTKILKHPQYPKFIWKPTIVDVGCGIGVGSNILSQEADMVWGIDKNENSILFAKEAFERVKNGIYYAAQVTFDQIDFINDNREFMKFDVVVAIEIIEHIYDYKKFLENLIKKFDNRSVEAPTEYFISSPNRINQHLGQKKPDNKYHVREWRADETLDVLGQYFSSIEMYNAKVEPIEKEEYRITNHTPILYKCSGVKI